VRRRRVCSGPHSPPVASRVPTKWRTFMGAPPWHIRGGRRPLAAATQPHGAGTSALTTTSGRHATQHQSQEPRCAEAGVAGRLNQAEAAIAAQQPWRSATSPQPCSSSRRRSNAALASHPREPAATERSAFDPDRRVRAITSTASRGAAPADSVWMAYPRFPSYALCAFDGH
jgi:hypothetical protein